MPRAWTITPCWCSTSESTMRITITSWMGWSCWKLLQEWMVSTLMIIVLSSWPAFRGWPPSWWGTPSTWGDDAGLWHQGGHPHSGHYSQGGWQGGWIVPSIILQSQHCHCRTRTAISAGLSSYPSRAALGSDSAFYWTSSTAEQFQHNHEESVTGVVRNCEGYTIHWTLCNSYQQ